MFSTFGPDTLKELRAAYSGMDRHTHVNRFLDMHDIGDMLVGAGYADPVMDMEQITLTYADVPCAHARPEVDRRAQRHTRQAGGLSGKSLLQSGHAATTKRCARDGRLPATFEVVYGHAWKPLPRVSADRRSR